MSHLSRREFAALVATGAVAGRIAGPLALEQGGSVAAVTAADIIDRIRKNVGVEWQPDTVDTLKAGNASTRVTGVVTTSMATMAVLQQAVASNANLVVTFEPTFFSRADAPTPPAGRGGGRGAGTGQPAPPRAPDPVFAAKNDFIARNDLVVFRLSDHWRRRTPDPLVRGFAEALDWAQHQSAADASRFDLPPVTLERLVATLDERLQTRGGLRVVGDPQMTVQRVALRPGSIPIETSLTTLPEVDVLVTGEVREWESTEYARDAIFSGQRKALVLLGRVVSEEPGMAFCADWMRAFVTEVPVRHIPVGDLVLEASMTAGDVIERIKQHIGVPWRDATYRDTFKFGGPETEVTGIATTAFVTMAVIEKAAAAGLNMIIPHEVTYWNDRDDTAVAGVVPLHQAKVDLMRRHDIVVFRIHDHMHAQRPDFTYAGSARAIGLDSRYETAPGSHRFIIPETTLAALAADVQKHSGARALRVVGDPDARVSRIQLGVGYASPAINNPDIDVLISGEQQESDGGFDNLAYVHDAATLGIPKGMIMLGHVVSEEAGMLEMAEWIRGFVPEVPVQLVEAGEPFWVTA